MKSSKLTHTLWRFALPSAILAGGILTSCEDELLTGTPSWLGSSIYAELQERGNFTQELALINDPALSEYPRILQLTGSKTLFVADDDAWAEFFKNNKWGARSMADLTTAQKQMLLKSSMIDNAYLIELLSNKQGNPPTKGACMRRNSSASMYDSIPRVAVASLPNLPYWTKVLEDNNEQDSIYIYTAHSMNDQVPMMHLLPDYNQSNLFTDNDMAVITNGEVTSNKGSYVNGVALRDNEGNDINHNITCQNGYVHIVNKVPYQLDNMADLVATRPELSIFSSMLDRFSVPVLARTIPNGDGTQSNVYLKRYLNSASASTFPDKDIFDALRLADAGVAWDGTHKKPMYVLRMDPGWNQYHNDVAGSEYITDGACLFAPTNDAFEEYARGEGKDLWDFYKSWDSIPLSTLCDLVNNHFQASMVASLPSKFPNLKDTASDSLGVSTNDIVDGGVFMACNGMVYETNRVFVAPEYRSVSFPTKVRDDLTVSQYAVESTNTLLNFKAYLTSTGARYCFIIPTDAAYANYIAPATYGRNTGEEYWNIEIENGSPKATGKYVSTGNDAKKISTDNIIYALRDVMQNHIIVLESEGIENIYNDKDRLRFMFGDPRQKIYTTMSGSPVRLDVEGGWENLDPTAAVPNIKLAGSRLMDEDSYITNDSVYIKGNGVSIVVNESPLMTTKHTPYGALLENEEYKEFLDLLRASRFLNNTIDKKTGIDMCITKFNNYHYTMYVPTNESIVQLEEDGFLPTRSDLSFLIDYNSKHPTIKTQGYDSIYNRLADMGKKYNFAYPDTSSIDEHFPRIQEVYDSLQMAMEDFLLYHIQDNALYLEGTEQQHAKYETACLDTAQHRFRMLDVNYDYNEFTVTPVWGSSRQKDLACRVIPEHSNVMTRQYVFDSASRNYVYSSSYVVIHQIDKPLFYKREQYIKPEDQ